MKSEIRMALLLLASTSAPAFAQDTPQCAALLDRNQNFFSANNAPVDAINRQCFLTVMPKDGAASLPGFPNLAQYPSPQLQEGTYEILLSGGGGGGGGGGLLASGGGGAGAVPSLTTQYLTPGVYKLTIGTSGKGGTAGGNGGDGNPTSITRAYTNETVAGYSGADTWAGRSAERYVVASAGRGSIGGTGPHDGSGGRSVSGQGNGGHGGTLPDRNGNGEVASESGGSMVVAGVSTGIGGMGGARDGGGGGGAGFGDGSAGKSTGAGNRTGLEGGNGFVRLRAIQLAQATPAAPMAAPIAAPAPYVAPAAAKRDRN